MLEQRRIGLGQLAWLLCITLAALSQSGQAASNDGLQPSQIRKTSLKVPGLKQAVNVYRDAYGMPAIYANSDDDLFLAFGYVTAEDRLFQLDYWRRTMSGRLAEIRGGGFVANDRYFRTIGLQQIADDVAARMDKDTRRILEQFSKGVNEYVRSHREKLPLEFKRLGYSPEPWKPADSVLIWQTLAYALDGAQWRSKVARAQTVAKFGAEQAREMFPVNDTSATIIQPGEMKGPFTATQPSVGALSGLGGYNPGAGSNNWVLAGKKSVTGKPILANDPHLPLTAPAVWYEVHLNGGHFDAAGLVMPGTPFLLMGNNANIAFGVTYSTVDITDVYEEKVNPANPTQYEYMGKWVPMDVRHEVIRVKDAQDVRVDVRSTRHGPLISEFTHVAGKEYALRWSNYELKTDELHGLRLINSASNWEQFKEGLRLYKTMTTNFIYADKAGNIGYYCAASIPIRKRMEGATLPVPGWTDEYEWRGYVPFEEQPHVYNPERGWVATANNKIAGDWYPYYLSNPDNVRQERIHEVLQSKDRFSLEDMKALQSDVQSTQPRQVVPLLLSSFETREASPAVQQALTQLRNWKNYDFDRKGIAPTIYEAFYRLLGENTFLDDVGGDRKLYTSYFGSWGGVDLNHLLLSNPKSKWFDDLTTPEQETAVDIMVKSFNDAVAELTKEFGADQREWRWERRNIVNIPHEVVLGSYFLDTGEPEALFPEFSLGPFQKEGRPGWTVNPSGYNSYRMVIDLSNLDNSVSFFPPGESGDPHSPHYKDQVPMWVDQTYHPKLHSRDRTVESAAELEVLEP